jgi:hypothetical protein
MTWPAARNCRRCGFGNSTSPVCPFASLCPSASLCPFASLCAFAYVSSCYFYPCSNVTGTRTTVTRTVQLCLPAPASSPPAHVSLAPGPPSELVPVLLAEPMLADIWSSASGEEGEGGLAEEWSSASGDESEAIPAIVVIGLWPVRIQAWHPLTVGWWLPCLA